MNCEQIRRSAFHDELEKIAKRKDKDVYGPRERLMTFGLGASPAIASQIGVGAYYGPKMMEAEKRRLEKQKRGFASSLSRQMKGFKELFSDKTKPLPKSIKLHSNVNNDRAVSNPLISKLQKVMNTNTKVYLDTEAAIRSGAGGYVPESFAKRTQGKFKPGVHLPIKKVTMGDMGTLSHEFGHAKNFETLEKLKLSVPYGLLRAASLPASVITGAIAVGAKKDENAKKSAIIGTAVAAPMLAEEGLATARGLHALTKMYGFGKALGRAGGAGTAALNLASYGSLAAIPGLAYLARKKIKGNKKYVAK